jgi:hypothetical protein
MAEPVVIHIQPADEGMLYYNVYLGQRFLLGPTRTPYIDSANTLIGLGYDPYRKLFMRRRGVDVNQLSYLIAVAAELGEENQFNPPNPYPLGPDGPGTVP